MTIAMLALAGFPATAGFIGKFYLIRAAVDGDYTWLAIMIVVGSMISLAYYLRVIAVMWMTPIDIELPTVPPRWVKAVSGWSPLADARAQPEVLFVAVLAAGGDDLLRHRAPAAVRRRARRGLGARRPAVSEPVRRRLEG